MEEIRYEIKRTRARAKEQDAKRVEGAVRTLNTSCPETGNRHVTKLVTIHVLVLSLMVNGRGSGGAPDIW